MGKIEEAAFGAGCFWGVEGAFMRIKGVKETEAGYMGGKTENPTYEEVCTGKTGHAETVHLRYSLGEVSYAELLKAFWGMHDPTTPNRQGLDMGSQYRSVIFYYNKKQREEAEKSKKEQQKQLGKRKIVTEILPAGKFWKAEEYHQKYRQKQGKA